MHSRTTTHVILCSHQPLTVLPYSSSAGTERHAGFLIIPGCMHVTGGVPGQKKKKSVYMYEGERPATRINHTVSTKHTCLKKNGDPSKYPFHRKLSCDYRSGAQYIHVVQKQTAKKKTSHSTGALTSLEQNALPMYQNYSSMQRQQHKNTVYTLRRGYS